MIEMIYVEGGTFQMGSNEYEDEKPVHKVEISSFFMGKYLVTQKQWRQVMGNNPSYFNGCDKCPVEQVSWDDVQEFLNRLNHQTGQQYCLPTEAEWEFAAQGGNKSRGYRYAGGNGLGKVAWYWSNSDDKTHLVGQKKPNELGLYDMGGNVWEWCQDWYSSDYYADSPYKDPQGPATGITRVNRGGSCHSYPEYSRVSYRNYNAPGISGSNIGFRLTKNS